MWDTHYTHISQHTHTHSYIHTHLYRHIHTQFTQLHTHRYTQHTQLHTTHTTTHTHTPTDTHTHNYTHIPNTELHTWTHLQTDTQLHTPLYRYIQLHTHQHTHTQLHTYTHTLLLQRLFLSPTFWTFCYSISTRTDSEAEAPILRTPDAKSQLTGNDPDAGKDWRQEEKEVVEDEMVGWHHWLNGHEFRQTQENSEVQGSLACCSSQGCKQLDTT